MKTNKEKLILTKEQARELVFGDLDGFEIIREKVVDTTRWSVVYEIIVRRKSDGKFFMDEYSVGATESQDESPYEYTEPNFTEVVQVQKTITDYE